MSSQSNKQIFEAIVEHIPLMIFVKDAAELRFVLFNRAGEELLGLERGVLHGKSDYDFFPKDQADYFTARDREVLEGKRPVSIEEPIETKTGPRFLLTKKVPILNESGDPVYLLGLSLDITERKMAERSRDEKAEALALAMKQSIEIEPQMKLAQRASDIGAKIGKLLAGTPSGADIVEVRALAALLMATDR